MKNSGATSSLNWTCPKRVKATKDDTIDSLPFFAKVERSIKFCFVASRRPSYRRGTCSSLHPMASLISLDQIDENKLAKCMCLARKEIIRSVFLIVPRVINYYIFCLNLSQHRKG